MHEHPMLYVQDVYDYDQREAQTLGSGERVLPDGFFACD